jgi:4-hydroxy-2-oxoheptanedioate aldolase
MTTISFAGQLRADGAAGTCRRGLWLTFLTPFGLEVAAAGDGGAEWIGIDVQHGDLELADVAPLARVSTWRWRSGGG